MSKKNYKEKQMKRTLIYLILFVLVLISGCSVLPNKSIKLPWNRIHESNQEIALNSKMMIEVSGNTLPLLGNESLTQLKIKQLAEGLMERRGFIFDNSDYKYKMKILYNTIKNEKYINIQSSSINSGFNNYEALSYNRYGLGTTIASSIRNTNNFLLSSTTNMNFNITQYTHTYAIEIYDNSNELIWKAETDWDSSNLDILAQSVNQLQILFSHLPNSNKPIRVKSLKESKFKAYFGQFINNKTFSCPALPYQILFKTVYSQNPDANINLIINTGSEKAMFAFIDLLQTAEFCLPNSKEDKWVNPHDERNWHNIILGGKYILDKSNQKINVLIELYSDSNGYNVKRCRIVSDNDFAEYENKIEKWKTALQNFYDFYE